MIVQGINTTGSTENYVNGSISIPANSTITIPLNLINSLLFDGQALSDILLGNLNIGDGVNTYSGGSANSFLQLACQFYNQSDKTASGSLTAAQPTQQTPVAGGTVVINTNGCSCVGFTILGTWVGTISYDGAIDGTNWESVDGLDLTTEQTEASTSSNTSVVIPCGSFQQVRVRMSAYTSGTANITANASIGNQFVQVFSLAAQNLQAQVVGNVASGAADAGKPIKIGGVFNTTLQTVTNGQRSDAQTNRFGELTFQYRNQFSNLTGNATTTVKSGKGRVHGIMINNASTGGTATFYDNTAGSGTKIATFTIGTPSGGLLSASGIPGPEFIGPLGLEFATGLTVVTAGSTSNDITILYQ